MWLLVVLALGCERAEGDREPAPRARPEVPGVETAVAETASIRDTVAAFGTVAPQGEPAEVRDARSALAEAEARRELAAQQVRRLEPLAGGVAPRKELDAARAEETAAAAAAARARQVLAAFGRDGDREPLGSGDRWLVARVVQLDLPRIHAGGDVVFAPDAIRDGRFSGRVDAPPAYVDPVTATAPVRVRVRDPDARLLPGMTGAVTFEVGSPRDAVVVPLAAVVYDDAQPLVFVAAEERYERRAVQLGVVRDGHAEIAAGLERGTRVVVTGAPSLLSASRLPAAEE